LGDCFEETGIGLPGLFALGFDPLERKDAFLRLRFEGDKLSDFGEVIFHRGRLFP
jgi:hypothetical protein